DQNEVNAVAEERKLREGGAPFIQYDRMCPICLKPNVHDRAHLRPLALPPLC
uniref:Uncharacterized protein n=1 Tax=Pristionchus pacificus TaxID=54126 RepID=A0A2A6D0Y0_PRIPA